MTDGSKYVTRGRGKTEVVRCSTERTFICTKRLVCIQDRKETQIGQKWILYKQVRSWTRHSHLIWFNARTGSLREKVMTPDVLEFNNSTVNRTCTRL